MPTRRGTSPLTYLECRERFRRAAHQAGAATAAYGLDATGPAGEQLTVDVAHLGSESPRRALLVPSGVHGIEGYAGSMIQSDLLERLAADAPVWGDAAIVLVHAVNPWGMAWWRRANEHNVDLNRNWQNFGASADEPARNDAYAEVHDLLCPDGAELPAADEFLSELGGLAEVRGLPWVRQAISGGQYSHPDGLYFGGTAPEPSTRIVDSIVTDRLAGAEAVLGVDLHTGHGAWGTYTLLSRALAGSAGDVRLRQIFDGDRIEITNRNPDATSAPKTGQLVPGAIERIAPERWWSVTFELGTRSETHMIVVERAEHWVHRRGNRDDPEHAAAIWAHRAGSIPDDAEWERTGLEHGRTVLDHALTALPDL